MLELAPQLGFEPKFVSFTGSRQVISPLFSTREVHLITPDFVRKRWEVTPKWHRTRTSNLLERTNKEVKRRTRIATLFPNEATLLRLVSAVLMEISEDWETEQIYFNMENRNSPEQG